MDENILEPSRNGEGSIKSGEIEIAGVVRQMSSARPDIYIVCQSIKIS